MTANIQHSTATSEHFTPPYIADLARKVMGGIDLDPASCELANEIIQAKKFYSIEDNGFEQVWSGNIFLNPPGGTNLGACFSTNSVAGQWFNKLYAWMSVAKHLGQSQCQHPPIQAIFVAFNLSVFKSCPQALTFPFCVPSQRIRFWTTPEQLLLNEAKKKNPRFDELQRYIRKCRGNIDTSVLAASGQLLIPSRAPSHDNAIIYLPPGEGTYEAISEFISLFRGIGNCYYNGQLYRETI
ncbi:MAG: hypothetical protein AAF329_01980 [Cyanobacteria bacterium P01_A01_bin.17]